MRGRGKEREGRGWKGRGEMGGKGPPGKILVTGLIHESRVG